MNPHGFRWARATTDTGNYRAEARNPTLTTLGHFLVKRVTNAGTFRLKHRLVFIANAPRQHHIGLEEVDDGIWSIYLGRVLLARSPRCRGPSRSAARSSQGPRVSAVRPASRCVTCL